nr:hypothetical protein [Tanacetum cinerariifolium]
MEDVAVASESSGTPSTIEKSPLNFANEDPLQTITERGGVDQVQDEVAYEIPPTGNALTTRVTLGTVLEEEVAAIGPHVNKRRRKRGKSLASTGLDAHDPSTAMKSVSDPEPLSYAKPQLHPEQDIAQSSKGTTTEIPTEDAATTGYNVSFFVGSPEAGRSSSVPSVMGEEKIKAAFKEFKKYEDDKVEHRCTEMDARLDKLSVDFDEELYSHMLTAIAGRHWVIGHGLRLAIIMCAESTEIRQAFADVVSARLAKGANTRIPSDLV